MSDSHFRYQSEYRRFLPHLHSYDKPIFITWRMDFGLPAAVIKLINDELSEFRETQQQLNVKSTDLVLHMEKKRFLLYDEVLVKEKSFPQTLMDVSIAEYVISAIVYHDQIRYNLMAYCLMPNHVHLLLTPLDDKNGNKYSLALIMKSIKGYSAAKINRYLNRKGSFWHREFYDRVIRDDTELARCLNYIVNNPVKAGLVEHWKDYPYTLIKAEYQKYLPSE